MNIFDNQYQIFENTVVTLGKFDGLHEGHRKLIETTVEEAKKRGYKSLVYTFNQNPRAVLKHEEIQYLNSREEKIEILKEMGVDYIVFQDFTYDFSKTSARKFAKEIIKGKLKAKMVVVGFNYRFGKKARGNIDKLKKYGKKFDFEVKVIEAVKKDGDIISSTALRNRKKIALNTKVFQ